MHFFVQGPLDFINFFLQSANGIISFPIRENADEYASIAKIGGGVNFGDSYKNTLLEGEILQNDIINGMVFDRNENWNGEQEWGGKVCSK